MQGLVNQPTNQPTNQSTALLAQLTIQRHEGRRTAYYSIHVRPVIVLQNNE